MDTFDLNESPAAVPAKYDPATCLERLGKLTASKAGVIMGGLDTSGLQTYVKSLAWERVYGARDEEYRNAAMDRGNALEPQALDWVEFELGQPITRTPGLMLHDSIPYVAASPDALTEMPDVVDPAKKFGAVIECKCPLVSAWMEVKRTREVPAEYRWQLRWQMWVCGKPRALFVCYHPVAGGLLLNYAVSAAECDKMAERAAVVDKMVSKWVEVLTS